MADTPIPPNVSFRDEIAAAAAANGLDPLLLAAIAAQETGGPSSDSGRNILGDGGHGHGVFQIDDRWHAAWLAGHHDGLDVAENAEYAAELLAANLRAYGSERGAVNAYNAGSPTAPSTMTPWPDGAVLSYPDSVFRHRDRLRRLAGGSAPGSTRPLLQRGDTGDGVRGLQRLLGVSDDGTFGSETEGAVTGFQKAHGLAADGVVGPATWSALLDGTTQPRLEAGAVGPPVARLQRFLGVPDDGDFGPQTTAALTAFQSAHAIAPTGIAGAQTWTALLQAVADGGAADGGGTTGQQTPSDRAALVAKLRFLPTATLQSDLEDPAKTRQHLIDLLATVVAHGFTPTITSVNSDHQPDNIPSMGGTANHGHTNGWAVDLYVDPKDAASFVHDCLYANPLVTKIGLGGVFQPQSVNGVGNHVSSQDDALVNGKVVFADNETNHIHLQTA